MNANLLLLLNALSTWYMVGLIWMVQIVHYKMFDRVGEDVFARYATDHARNCFADRDLGQHRCLASSRARKAGIGFSAERLFHIGDNQLDSHDRVVHSWAVGRLGFVDAAADQGLVTIIVVGLSFQPGNRLSHQRESFRRPSVLRP